MLEDLEKELKEIKAEQYDMDTAFKTYQEKMSKTIADINLKIAELKGEKTEEVVAEESIQIPTPEKEIVESNEQEIVLPVGDENQEENKEDVANTEVNETEVSIPGVSSNEVGIGTRELDQTPLTPTTAVVEEKQPVKKQKKIMIQTSSDPAKAIMVSRSQKDKLSTSLGENDKKVFGETSSEGKEINATDDIKKELQKMYDELPQIDNEAERTVAIDKINVLTKQLEKTA